MKRKIVALLLILGVSIILSADLLDKIQRIDSLEQQGKYAQAEKEARALLSDPSITPSERASVQNILSSIARKKAAQAQPTQQPVTAGTEGVPGVQTQLGPDGQPLPAVPAGPSAIDSGTIQATSKDDVSDGSKFKTYDNYEKAVLGKPTSSAIYSLCSLYFKDGLYERAVKLAKKDKARDVLSNGGTYTDILTIIHPILGATNIIWNCMDGSYIPVTVQLAFDVVTKTGDLDGLLYGTALYHKQGLYNSVTPETYNYKVGWPTIYGE